MISPKRSVSAVLVGAVSVYLLLAVTCVRTVGLVGETAIGWALPSPPEVRVSLATSQPDTGLLRALQTRPTERLVLGSVEFPLAVNAYTGGPPDWPARVARALTGSLAAGIATHVGLGLLLLVLAHRFLRFHGTAVAAGAAALVLATDWGFVFYRKVLGGTEVLLLAAGLLVVWALFSRRWKGGVHGTVAIAVGVGLGLLAKATFASTLVAIAIAALLTRWDHPALKPPRRVHAGALLGITLLCVSPLIVAAIHHVRLPPPYVLSHDTLAMQLTRLSAPSPAREGLANLAFFFGNPLAFFHEAYGAVPVAPLSTLRGLGYAVTLLGIVLEWRAIGPEIGRAQSPSGALLRFLSLCVPLQIALLFLANHDLHHLAQSTVLLALLVGLAAERVAATVAPPRSAVRALAVGLLVSPHLLAGIHHLRNTDAIVSTVRSPTFTEAGQQALVEALRAAGVTRLVTSDYEVYGMLDARAPEIAITHTWAAVSHGDRDVLPLASGGWYLEVRASAPMIYNWRPKAVPGGTVVAELSDAFGVWARLWKLP